MSRRKSRPEKRRQSSEITIVSGVQETYLETEKGIKEDLDLTRSALLYSDHVHLYSMTAAILKQLLSASQLPAALPIKFILDSVRSQPTSHQPDWLQPLCIWVDQYVEIWQTTSRDQRRHMGSQFLQLEQKLKPMSRAFRLTQTDMWNAHGGPQLDEAVRAGQLTIHAEWANELFLNGDLDQDSFLRVLQSHISTTNGSLLFDTMMGGLVTAASKEQKLTIPSQSRHGIRRTKTGTAMISYLPTFPGADVGDVLEAKSIIKTPLAAYQDAVKELEVRISASAESEDDVDDEITFIWHDHVEPRIQELQRAFTDTQLPRLSATAKGFVKGATPPGMIFMAGTAASEHTELTGRDIEHIATLLEPIGLSAYLTPEAAGVASLVWGVKRAYDGWKSANSALRAVRQDGLFYLVDAQRALDR